MGCGPSQEPKVRGAASKYVSRVPSYSGGPRQAAGPPTASDFGLPSDYYEVIRLLGHGGEATTYLVREKANNRERSIRGSGNMYRQGIDPAPGLVAMKIMPRGSSLDEKFVMRELPMLAQYPEPPPHPVKPPFPWRAPPPPNPLQARLSSSLR